MARLLPVRSAEECELAVKMMYDEATAAQPFSAVRRAEGIRNEFARLLVEIDGAQCKSSSHGRRQGRLAVQCSVLLYSLFKKICISLRTFKHTDLNLSVFELPIFSTYDQDARLYKQMKDL